MAEGVTVAAAADAALATPVGLWQVVKVEVGSEEMTPVARWVRLREDFTQESGNGWLQHSYGAWGWDTAGQLLSLVDSNGLEPPGPAFAVQLAGDVMRWQRQEGDQLVRVQLQRIERLPKDAASGLIGQWQLVSAVVDGKDQTDSLNPDGNRRLQLRWDRQFRDRNGPGGNRAGVWTMHGHRPELTLWHYGDSGYREVWLVEVSPQRLKLTTAPSEEGAVQELVFAR